MLEQAIEALSETGRVLVLRNGTSLPIQKGSLREILTERNISEKDIRKVLQHTDNIIILSVEEVVNHDVDIPLMRVNNSKQCAWSSPKYIRTIRGALAVV